MTYGQDVEFGPAEASREGGVESDRMLGTGLLATREVVDKWGFRYHQFPDGKIQVAGAPEIDNFGYWMPGSTGGQGQGAVIAPRTAMWHKVTKMIGPHPYQTAMRQHVLTRAGYRGWGAPGWGWRWPWEPKPETPTTAEEIAFTSQAERTERLSEREEREGTGWTALTDILSGFTETPASSTAGQVTSAFVEATPGLMAFGHQVIHPGTYQSLQRELAQYQGELARTTDPARRAELESRIQGVQWQIAELQKSMAGGEGAPVATPFPWLPVALGLGLLLAVGGIAVAVGRRGDK
jgi:hypothetical protein